uniref:Uncharacterized protein n=1 Tax=Oryzias melastigma TaxID=30732 RepID=A0A3B3BHL1_ORYME
MASRNTNIQGLSKKSTIVGSLSRDASTCSKEKDHSVSDSSDPASWLLWELSQLSGVTAPCSVEESSAGDVPAAFSDSDGLLGSCSLRPTSSILRRRLVTWAMARYRDSSSGWPWKML